MTTYRDLIKLAKAQSVDTNDWEAKMTGLTPTEELAFRNMAQRLSTRDMGNLVRGFIHALTVYEDPDKIHADTDKLILIGEPEDLAAASAEIDRLAAARTPEEADVAALIAALEDTTDTLGDFGTEITGNAAARTIAAGVAADIVAAFDGKSVTMDAWKAKLETISEPDALTTAIIAALASDVSTGDAIHSAIVAPLAEVELSDVGEAVAAAIAASAVTGDEAYDDLAAVMEAFTVAEVLADLQAAIAEL
jgi:hypothetical protein